VIKKSNRLPGVVLKVLIALVFISPFYIMCIYAFKNRREIMLTGLALPTRLTFENFINVFKTTQLARAFLNTVFVTVVMVAVTVLASSMAAYIIARKNTRFYNGIYFMFFAAIILPFQVIMLPMYRVLFTIGLMNTLPGYILAKCALELGLNVFLFTGFIKTVPRDMDDAAWVDGAGRMYTFWRIILPLLKPIIMTVVVLNAISVWNDLLAAQIILQSNRLRTLTLEQYSFISQFSTDLGKAFAAFMMSIIPMIILYLTMQKYIISGIVAGAVKG
jgi:raffinose/stachyose/melibiose transport system permease protein